jgi:hypothetical protein
MFFGRFSSDFLCVCSFTENKLRCLETGNWLRALLWQLISKTLEKSELFHEEKTSEQKTIAYRDIYLYLKH